MVDFNDDFAAPGEWARQYRQTGLQIVPGWMPSEVPRGQSWKRPKVKDWRQYQDVLITDEVFLPWYGPGGEHVGRPNMGTICGRCSGNLFIIDLDVHKNPAAAAWWEGVIATHNNRMALETAEQRTGGGGRQILFYAPPGYRTPTCKTSIGVDIRGQGGFAVLAPSIHDSGAAYAWLEGMAPWDEAGIMMAPDWLLREIEALVAEHGGTDPQARPTHQSGAGGNGAAFDGFGHQTDGREEYMRDLIWAAVVDWYRDVGPEMPDLKSQNAREGEKYLVYEREVSPQNVHPNGMNKTDALNAEGRGPGLFHVKWQRAMSQWNTKVAEEAAKPGKDKTGTGNSGAGFNPWADEFAKTKTTPPPPADLYERLTVRQIKTLPPPKWLVEGLVIEQALGFIFGPPGSLKTFIALDLALSLASGRPSWWGRSIQGHGAVIYICSEGTASLGFRIQAWEAHRKVNADAAPFVLIRQSINFMHGDDVLKLLHTVQAVVDEMGPVAAVFVDTVSRVLPGAEENLQKDMTLFVSACDAIRQHFKATVFGLHHTNASGGFRGSTVMPGAGDFIIECRREPQAMDGSIVAKKIKDADDGWQQSFTATKVTIPGILPRTSLVVDGAPPAQGEAPQKRTSNWPLFEVREEILAALDEAWCRGEPWSHSRSSSRWGVNHVVKRWGVDRKVAEDLLATWLAKGIIVETVFSTKTKMKGYQKRKSF